MKAYCEKIMATACIVTAASGIVGLSACATIIHSRHQDVGIASEPTGAAVWIDNADKGKTPVVAKLSRKDTHLVRIELPGYKPFEATLTRKVSGWVWGNIVFGGLIGLGVDAMSGGMYNLSPGQVSAALITQQASVQRNADGLYVLAVLRPQADWTKVGQLQSD